MSTKVRNFTKRDRIAGAIIGFAIGDAMGATTEFMNEGQIKLKYGQLTDIIGGGWLNLAPGEVTDDTQMTMCVMNALMKTQNEEDLSGKLNINLPSNIDPTLLEVFLLLLASVII